MTGGSGGRLPVIDCIIHNRVAALEELLSSADAHEADSDNDPDCLIPGLWIESEAMITPLQLAITTGHPDIVNVLLAAGANPDLADRWGNTPLIWAADKQQTAIAHRLLQARADPAAKSNKGKTALYFAARNGDQTLAQALLAAGVPVNPLTDDNRSPLYQAIIANHTEMVRLLLSHGARVDCGGGLSGLLGTAIGKKNTAVMVQLIKAGIDPNGEHDRDGDQNATLPLVISILPRGNDPNNQGFRDQEDLVWRLTELLLNGGADPNLADNVSLTPFATAAARGRLTIMSLLHQHGARVTVPDPDSYVAFLGDRSIAPRAAVVTLAKELGPVVPLQAACRLCIRQTILKCRKEGESLISNAPRLPLPPRLITYVCNITS